MIIGVDIGGTKTVLARFTDDGQIMNETRFITNQSYEVFLEDLKTHAPEIKPESSDICVVAVPGLLDRQAGIVESLGNLPWQKKPIAHDISEILGNIKTYIENDSKLAGLAEAMLLPESKRTLYVTISTGIGAALVVDGHLSQDVIDMEIGKMPLLDNGTYKAWESFASGSAFVQRFGKRGEEITDENTWKIFANDMGEGISIACSIFQLDSIVFGGGFGQYAKNFIPHLQPFIESLHPIIRRPDTIIAAHHKDKSSLYGCYHYGAALSA